MASLVAKYAFGGWNTARLAPCFTQVRFKKSKRRRNLQAYLVSGPSPAPPISPPAPPPPSPSPPKPPLPPSPSSASTAVGSDATDVSDTSSVASAESTQTAESATAAALKRLDSCLFGDEGEVSAPTPPSPASPTPATSPPPSKVHNNIALFIDGDPVGYDHWPLILEKVQTRGTVTEVQVFAAPAITQSNRFKKALKAVGGECVPVPRYLGGKKDPNDIALTARAAFAAGRRGLSVALAVQDTDFAVLASMLSLEGIKVLVVLPDSSPAMQFTFLEAKAEVLHFSLPHRDMAARGARWKWVMQGDGSCTKHPIAEADRYQEDIDLTSPHSTLSQRLLEAGYLESLFDPIVPAIVKAHLAHSEGPVTVYPTWLSVRDGNRLLDRHPRLKHNPRKHIVVIPRSAGSFKFQLPKYGSVSCGQHMRGGAPFVLEDGPTDEVVSAFLAGLGFYKPQYDGDLDEALNAFAGLARNRRNLRDLGFGILPALGPWTARACLHAALSLPNCTGNWSPQRSDASIAKFLLDEKFLGSVDCEVATLNVALGEYLKRKLGKQELPTNFQSRVILLRQHRIDSNPRGRKQFEE